MTDRDLILSLAERLTICSGLLSRCAERKEMRNVRPYRIILRLDGSLFADGDTIHGRRVQSVVEGYDWLIKEAKDAEGDVITRGHIALLKEVEYTVTKLVEWM